MKPPCVADDGMETDDESVMVYANINNVKKFDVVVYKSERKLLSRRGLKAGDSINIQIKPCFYFLSVRMFCCSSCIQSVKILTQNIDRPWCSFYVCRHN